MTGAKNVLGKPLKICCTDPVTGFYRTGKCDTGPGDLGLHIVCARVTAEFLRFSRSRGNDLTTPFPEAGFPGLKPGDKWCLCAARWKEAMEAGADLLLKGAYTQSRIRQMIFGGGTRHIIMDSKIPVLMAR